MSLYPKIDFAIDHFPENIQIHCKNQFNFFDINISKCVSSTLITASSSTVYDANTLYSKVACYTIELLKN